MTRVRRLLYSIAVVVLVGGCGEPGGSFTDANNNVRVPIFGLGEGDAFDRVTVPVEFVQARPEIDDVRDLQLRFSDATIVGNLTTGYARMYTEVTNISGTPLCFVEAEAIEFFDMDGVVLATESSFVLGSTARTRYARQIVHNCLIEEQTGAFVSLIEALDATRVARVRMSVLATDAWQYDGAEANIVPTQIEVSATGSLTELAVTLENEGLKPAVVERSRLMLFDDSGQFLDWTFASDTTPAIVASDETTVTIATLVTVHGTPTEALVHVSWDE